jgi:hypothetical protein
MRNLIPTLTLAGTLMLGACASPAMWTKPNVSFEDWRSDQYSCERDMRIGAASFGNGYTRAYYAQQFYNRCLEAKGYSRVTQ